MLNPRILSKAQCNLARSYAWVCKQKRIDDLGRLKFQPDFAIDLRIPDSPLTPKS